MDRGGCAPRHARQSSSHWGTIGQLTSLGVLQLHNLGAALMLLSFASRFFAVTSRLNLPAPGRQLDTMLSAETPCLARGPMAEMKPGAREKRQSMLEAVMQRDHYSYIRDEELRSSSLRPPSTTYLDLDCPQLYFDFITKFLEANVSRLWWRDPCCDEACALTCYLGGKSTPSFQVPKRLTDVHSPSIPLSREYDPMSH